MSPKPLYAVWTRHKVPFDRTLFHLIAASVLWRILGLPLVNHLIAMNNIRWISLWSMGQALVLFALAVPGAHLFHVTGVAAAILVSEMAGSFVIPVLWMHNELPLEERRLFVVDQVQAVMTPVVASVTLFVAGAVTAEVRPVVLLAGGLVLAALLLKQLQRIPPEIRRDVAKKASSLLRRDTATNGT